MAKVIIYSKKVCPYCVRAKNLLNQKGVRFEEILMDDKLDELDALKKKSGHMTVPIIYINDQMIGGYDDMAKLDAEGKLDALLGI